jgi:uncharacterized protein (TIGR02466 family)
MQVENIFPTPILKFDLPGSLIEKSLDLAEKFVGKNKWYEKNHLGSTITTYHEDIERNYCGNNDSDLSEHVIEMIRKYLHGIGFDPNSSIRLESWLNLNKPATHHSVHEHYGSFVSAVVWLKTSKDSGNFVFHEPLGVKAQNFTQYLFAKKEENMYNYPLYSLNPKSGNGIIFPSWMPHQVQPNKSNQDRYSVAFNAWMIKDG